MKTFIQFLLKEDSPDAPYSTPGSFTSLDKKPPKEGDKPDGTTGPLGPYGIPAPPGPYDTPANFNNTKTKPIEGDEPLKEVTNKKMKIWLKQLRMKKHKRPHLKGKYFNFKLHDDFTTPDDTVDELPTKRTVDSPFTRTV